MSDEVANEIAVLCRGVQLRVAWACGDAMAGAPEAFKHIALMNSASWMMHAAAMSAFFAFRGEQVSAGDPRVQALVHDWLDAMKLYPDVHAVEAAMTQARDKAFPDV